MTMLVFGDDNYEHDEKIDVLLDANGFPVPVKASSAGNKQLEDGDSAWEKKPSTASDDDSLWGAHQDDFSVSVYQNATPQTTVLPIGRIETVTEPPTTRISAAAMTPKRCTQTPSGRSGRTPVAKFQAEGNKLTVPFPSPTKKKQSSQAPPDDVWEASEELSLARDGAYPDNLSRSSHDLFSLQRASEGLDYLEFLKSERPKSPDGLVSRFNKSFGDLPSSSFEDTAYPTSAGDVTSSTKKKNGSRAKQRISNEIETKLVSPRSGGKSASRSDKSASTGDRVMNGKRASRRDRSRDEEPILRRHPFEVERASRRGSSIPAEKSLRGDRTGTKASRSKDTSTRGERITDRSSRSERSTNKSSRRSRSTGPLTENTTSNRARERSSRRDRSAEPRVFSKSPIHSTPSRTKNGKREARQSTVSERRVPPQRSKSDDGSNLFRDSLQDLVALGISLNKELTDSSFADISAERPLPIRKAPARVKSMSDDGIGRRQRLHEGLGLVDRNVGSSKCIRRKSDEKSTGSSSLGSGKPTESTSSAGKYRSKRISNSGLQNNEKSIERATTLQKRQPDEKSSLSDSSLSVPCNQEIYRGRAEDDGGSYNDRRTADEVKLAREKRKAEEARLRRLREESRLLEEKRMAEEVRLKALRAESKLLEAKRLEEEARLRVEAKIAKEQRKAEETKLRKALEDSQPRIKEDPSNTGRAAKGDKNASTQNRQDRNFVDESIPAEKCNRETNEWSTADGSQISSSVGRPSPRTMDKQVTETQMEVDTKPSDQPGQVDLTTDLELLTSRYAAPMKPHVVEENTDVAADIHPLRRKKSVTERIALFSASIQTPQLPPAFQLIRDQTKRIQKK